MILRYYLVDQYWVHQVSSTCPTTPENDMGQSNSGTEMSIYTLVVQVETDAGLQMDKHQVHPLSLSIVTKVMIKQSWHYMILGYKTAPIIRGWLRSTFWGQLTFVVSRYAWHDISILLWCCHHPAQLINLQVYFQVGMIIGDTQQHNKQYMWLLWRKWLT